MVLTSTKGTMDPEGTHLLTYVVYANDKPRLCMNIHYNVPRLTLTGRLQIAMHATLYAVLLLLLAVLRPFN